jgi:23S rRNA (uracil1939-C5)-methyltransferase
MSLSRVRIEKLIAGGAGLARTPSGVVLVAGALPDELVEVEIAKKRGTLEGTLRRVIEPSPSRERPPRGTPPTADLAHATYPAQLEYKHGFVQEALERIAKLEFAVLPTEPSPLEWRYRNTAQYMVTPAGIGYRQPNTHRAWLLESDPLVGEVLSDGLAALNGETLEPTLEIALRGSFLTGEVLACLIGKDSPNRYNRAVKHLRDLGVSGVSYAFASLEGRFRAGIEHLWGAETILEQYGDFAVQVSASGFAQVNPLAASNLYRKARDLAGSGKLAVDVYGGSGTLGLHLTTHFQQVQVIEISPEAVARGQSDAARLERTNLHFTRGDASRLEGIFADCIALDPPRAGLSQDVVRSVLLARAPKLLYVSCDPATWARDVAKLVRGGYRLTFAQPWDFYPQTSHVEVLSLLEL